METADLDKVVMSGVPHADTRCFHFRKIYKIQIPLSTLETMGDVLRET